MKIAAVTEDGTTISAHFGRATHYVVVSIEAGRVVSLETLAKPGHREFHREEGHLSGQAGRDSLDHQGHGFGRHAEEKHRRMFAPILDCQVVLARGMGRGAYLGLQQAGLRPVVTDIEDIESAALAAAAGTIEDQIDLLH